MSTQPTRRQGMQQRRQSRAQMVAQIKDMGDDIASMRRTLNGIGDESDWQDLRISELEENIAFWEGQQQKVIRELALHDELAARPVVVNAYPVSAHELWQAIDSLKLQFH